MEPRAADPEALIGSVVSAEAKGRHADATALATMLAAALPALRSVGGRDLLLALLALAQVAIKDANHDLAARYLTEARDLDDGAGALVQPLDQAQLFHMEASAAKAQRHFDEAARGYGEALRILEPLGPDVDDFRAIVLGNLGDLEERRGRLTQSVVRYREAAALTSEPITTSALFADEGRAYSKLGMYPEAAWAQRKALDIRRQINGADALVAESLTHVAAALAGAGDFPKAEDTSREVVTMWHSLPDHQVDEAKALEDLATLFVAARKYSEAGTAYAASRSIFEAMPRRPARELAILADNEASLAFSTGRTEAAKRLSQEALADLSRDDPTDVELVIVRQNVAIRDLETGDLAEAEALATAGLAVAGSPDTQMAGAVWLGILGGVRHQQRRFDEALELERRALALSSNRFGPTHPSVTVHHDNLATVLAAAGRNTEALSEAMTAERGRDTYLDALFGCQTEAERMQTMSSVRRDFHALLTIALRLATEPEAAHAAFAVTLQRQAIVVEATSLALGMVSDPEGGKLRQLRAEIASLQLGGAGDIGRLDALLIERDALEERLARSAPAIGFVRRLRRIGLEDVVRGLPADSVLINYVWFTPVDFAAPASSDRRSGPPRYLGFGLASDGKTPLTMVDLGEAASIDAGVEAWRREITGARTAHPNGGSASDRPDARLASLLLEPFKELLGSAKRLVVVPDGAVARAPLAALPHPSGGLVLDRAALTLVDSARDVAGWRHRVRRPSGQPYVAGAVDYDAAPDPAGPIEMAPALPFDIDPLRAINATVVEVRHIAKLLDVDAATGRSPTIEAIRKLRSPRVLHLATHGCFLPLDMAPTVLDPMLRSGIALAGFNRALAGEPRLPGTSDGFLSAEEVVALSLSGTRLVVLSACDTGLGDIVDNEGVLGLRRGFAIAGADAVVMSLWHVPDEATAQLMIEFHGHIKNHVATAVALRKAQIAVRSTFPASVDHWAAFVVSGR